VYDAEKRTLDDKLMRVFVMRVVTNYRQSGRYERGAEKESMRFRRKIRVETLSASISRTKSTTINAQWKIGKGRATATANMQAGIANWCGDAETTQREVQPLTLRRKNEAQLF
jgi:hypothetical protein